MTDSKNTINDDDPVVKEIPLYLSKTFADNLFVFQYPLRPAAEGYDNATFSKALIKPQNQEVQMELTIDTSSLNYDHRRGEQIALNIDGPFDRFAASSDDRFFDGDHMDKTILQSSKAVPDCSNYSVGVFQDGELHITPLRGILQLRPQFDYLDSKTVKSTKDEPGTVESDNEEDEAQEVNVTFVRQKSEFSKKMQEQSFQQYTKKLSEESWITAVYRDATSSQANLSRMDMFCSSGEASTNNLQVSFRDYLQVLASSETKDEDSSWDLATYGTSLNYIRTLPLLDQVRTIMREARVMSFPQLRTIITTDHDTGTILKYLQQVAVLVQGNWIVNSELLYPANTTSQNGIPSELMCRARDLILLAFTENEYVDRKATTEMIKLPPDDIKEIFENLGRVNREKGWHLVNPIDTEFAIKYPEISQRQEMIWEAKRKNLKEVMASQNHPPPRQRKRSNRESIGSENEERNVGRGRKNVKDISNDSAGETVKNKKTNRQKKTSDAT